VGESCCEAYASSMRRLRSSFVCGGLQHDFFFLTTISRRKLLRDEGAVARAVVQRKLPDRQATLLSQAIAQHAARVVIVMAALHACTRMACGGVPWAIACRVV
jgi:hypothetical protein